jgi:ribosome recycling factor
MKKKVGREVLTRDADPTGKSVSSNLKDDQLDFSQLQCEIADAVLKLKNEMSKLRTGGRFNAEAIESLRLSLAKGNKNNVRVGDLAQVVPKGGRTLMILVGEEDVR